MNSIASGNPIWSSGVYPLLVASFGFATVSLTKAGTANLRIWQVLLLAIMVSALIKYCAGLRFSTPGRLPLLVLLPLTLSVILSGVNANRIDYWAKQSILLFGMLFLFLIVSQRWSREQILQNIRWVIYPAILVAGWGILEMLIFPEDLPFYYSDGSFVPRTRSFFAEANEFSQFLALPFAYLFSALIYFRKVFLFERWLFGVGLLIVILAQVLSFSRGGLVVFFAEILTWYMLTSLYSKTKNSWFSWRKSFSIVSLSFIVAISLDDSEFTEITRVLWERLTSLFSGNDSTSKIRWDSITLAISEVISSPTNFVVGMGLGNLPLLLGEGVATTANFIVDVFAELGLVGLFSMLIILGVALVFPLRTLKRLLKEKDEEMLTAFFGAYLSFVGLIAGGMTYATHMLNIFWFVCGLLFALYQYNRITVARERMG
jgi:hypothetical protein